MKQLLATTNRSAVIFDLDGTLTRPYLDFDAIRREIGISSGTLLEALELMPAEQKARAHTIILRHEWDAARNASLHDHAVETVAACRAHGHAAALLTRNTRSVVDFVLSRFGFVFDAIRTRDDGAIKPSAQPVLSICEEVRADPAQSWVIGDFLYDILSGRAAGARTVLMIGDAPSPDYADQADFVIRCLSQLPPILGLSQA